MFRGQKHSPRSPNGGRGILRFVEGWENRVGDGPGPWKKKKLREFRIFVGASYEKMPS